MNQVMVITKLKFIKTEFDFIKGKRTVTRIKDCLIWKPKGLHEFLEWSLAWKMKERENLQ